VAFICRGDFVVTTGSEATRTLIVGMGCRRGVPAKRLEEALLEGIKCIGRTLKEIRLIATVEDKGDENGDNGEAENPGVSKLITRKKENE